MTPQEIHAALHELKAVLPKSASLGAHINEWKPADSAAGVYVHPFGVTSSRGQISCYAATWEEAFAAVRAEVAAWLAKRAENIPKRMAIAIIAGDRTVEALKASGFSSEEIDQFSGRACEIANEIATTGPFSIEGVSP